MSTMMNPRDPECDDDDDSMQHIKRGSVEIPDDDLAETIGAKFVFSWRKLWAFTGPGFLMSIAYLDPGNLESDLQAGAQTGYSLLWVLWWSTVIGLFLQLLSARLGVVTGMNLAQKARAEYSPPLKYTLWIMMELAIISSDIQEVIGSAIAIRILSQGKIELWQGALITGADTFTFLLLERYGLRKLEAFFAALITTMSITFGYMYFAHLPDQLEVLKGTIIPSTPGEDGVTQAVGILGAVIMPHNLYLHSALVQSRKVEHSDAKKTEANIYNGIESSIALFISFLINLFVIAVFAKGFSTRDGTETKFAQCDRDLDEHQICGSQKVDLLSAGCCLGAEFAPSIKYIWAIGLLAAGQSSTMTGTYAGQFVMEGFLQIKIAPWKRVLLTRSFAMIPTVLVAALTSPHILGTVNEWMNVLQSMLLPFAMLPLLHFTSRKSVMGKFANGPIATAFGWGLSLVVIAINLYQVFSSPPGEAESGEFYYWPSIVLVSLVYMLLVTYLFVGPWVTFPGNTMVGWYTKGDGAVFHVSESTALINDSTSGSI